MADKPIATALPADLPENWQENQIVSPGGTEAGLDAKHGYNYQSKQINDAQKAINTMNEAFEGLSPSSHTHAAADITSGALQIAQGGTGATTAAAARSNLGACTLAAPVTVTVKAASWAGSGPWTQTVTVAGVTASDAHLTVLPVDIADDDARKLYAKAYGCLAAEADSAAGGVLLTCRDACPEINFDVIVKGVR